MATLGTLAVCAWGLAASAIAGAGGVSAETQPQFRDVETVLLVPGEDEWQTLKVAFFMLDDGTGTFDQAVQVARQEMLDQFPGAVELAPGEISAAYVMSGFKWMGGSASWDYNASGEPSSVAGGAYQAMQAAAATWGQQGVTFQFTGGGATGAGTGACGGGTDGQNTVGWGAQSGSVLAVTCSWFSNSGNPKPAVEFDMQFDPDWNWTLGSPTSVDLQSVALHEFGHALGLNHSGDGSAVMYASYSSGSQKRTPTADDVAGLAAIYGGAGGGAPTNTPPPPSPTNTPPPPPPTNTPTPIPPTNTPTPQNPGGSTPPVGGFTPVPTNTPVPTIPIVPPTQGGGSNPPFPTATPTPPKTVPPTATPTKTVPPVASPTATPTRSPTVTPPSLPIVPGANLLAWPGNNLPPAQALAGLEKQITIVYSWDARTGTWQRFGPSLPSYLNTMDTMKKGNAYWFIATSPARILFAE